MKKASVKNKESENGRLAVIDDEIQNIKSEISKMKLASKSKDEMLELDLLEKRIASAEKFVLNLKSKNK